MNHRILLLSTVHPSVDPRIVFKIVPSLKARYEVFCALPMAGREEIPGVTMVGLPSFKRLLYRLLFSYPVVIWKCLRIRPALVHFFVPELIPLAFIFKWMGSAVIFEVQENLYQKFDHKQYNKSYLFRRLYGFFERLARKNFYYLFTEHAYTLNFTGLRYPSAVVHNYVSLPLIDSILRSEPAVVTSEKSVFFYSGVISLERSIDVMIKAFERYSLLHPDFQVELFGRQNLDMESLSQLSGYDRIKSHMTFYGYTDQRRALIQGKHAVAGLALLKPVGDYPDSYPTKIFEYMAMSLPVITSDFPLYAGIIEKYRCGFCISPFDADALASTMTWLTEHPAEAKEMGRRGRMAVVADYNWEREEHVLLSYYQLILGKP